MRVRVLPGNAIGLTGFIVVSGPYKAYQDAREVRERLEQLDEKEAHEG